MKDTGTEVSCSFPFPLSIDQPCMRLLQKEMERDKAEKSGAGNYNVQTVGVSGW